jgi:uncharacterized membrane protein YfcA
MNIYFPIAEINANLYLIIAIGLVAGVLSNIFGIGGGFIATPFLVAIGVPPYIATACATQQIIGSSLMGVLTRLKPLSVDFKLAGVLAFFGLFGSYLGVVIVQKLKTIGYVDALISFAYVIVMTTTGLSIILQMASKKKELHNEASVKKSFVEGLPFKMKFEKSERNISLVFLGVMGFFVGILTGIMGIGGGFIMVPIMTYILKLKKSTIVGTSLMQILIITIFVTAMNVFKAESLDLLLGSNLIIGGVFGSFIGGIIARKLKFDSVNFLLAILILSVSVFFAFNLLKTPTEHEMFTLEFISQ